MNTSPHGFWSFFRQRFQRDLPEVVDAAEAHSREYGAQTDANYGDKSVVDDVAAEMDPEVRRLLFDNRAELIDTSRRAILKGAGVLVAFATGVAASAYVSESDKRDQDRINGEFIDQLRKARESGASLETLRSSLVFRDVHRQLVEIVIRFQRGGYATSADIDFLTAIENAAGDDQKVRYFVANHLSAELMRRGFPEDALAKLQGFSPAEIPSDLALAHDIQLTSIQFNALPRHVFAGPGDGWRMGDYIRRLRGHLAVKPGQLPDDLVSVERRKGLLELRGLYLHAWCFNMLQLAASATDEKDRREIWDSLLRLFDAGKEFPRPVSNGLLVLAIQAHHASDRHYRDAFLSHWFARSDFWGDPSARVGALEGQLAIGDHMASLGVLFLESLRLQGLAPPWADAIAYGRDLIASEHAPLANRAIQKAMQNVRKRGGSTVDAPATFEANAYPSEIYSLYLV